MSARTIGLLDTDIRLAGRVPVEILGSGVAA